MTEAAAPGREGRRQAILAAAIEVFAERGFAGAHIRDIAARAGVGEGTVYLYFAGKDDLLLTAFRETLRRFCQEARAAIGAQGPFEERLRRLLCFQAAQVEAHPALATMLLMESRQSRYFYGEPVRAALREYAALYDELLAEGQRRGELRPDVDPVLARRALLGAIQEVALDWLLGDRARPLAPRAQALADLFCRGLCT